MTAAGRGAVQQPARIAPSPPPAQAPPAASDAPASPSQVCSQSPADLWAATLAQLADRPSLVWLRHLRLEGFEGDAAIVTVAPGQREVQHVATPQRLEIVAQKLGELRARRTRIDLRLAPTSPLEPHDAPTDEPDAPARRAGLDRRTALQLPIVRAALQAFPDAMLVDARQETDESPATAPAAETPSEDGEQTDV